MIPQLQQRNILLFDLLDLPRTIRLHREHMARKPGDAIAHANLVMALDLADNVPVEKTQAERKRWYDQHVKDAARAEHAMHANDPDPERALRIAYLSADIRQHSAMYAIAPIIGYHNRDRFHVSVYSSTRPVDHYTDAVRGSANRFMDVHGWTDAQLAHLIEADRIDVIVDCSGHSAGFRLECLARKPAPIQISAWGYNLGTGLPQVDCLVSDPTHIEEGERGFYTEKILDMPCALTYQYPPYTPEVGPLPALEKGYITFGVLNRMEKISDACLRAWAMVMRRVDGSKIIIKDRHLSDRNTRRTLLRRFKAVGIGEERINLRGVSHHLAQLQTFYEIDLQLDTYPQGGGISTAEALIMGVPVLGMKGRVPASRNAASILASIGHPEWVARNEHEYVEHAVALASDRERLAAIRAKLREDVTTSYFGNPQKYTALFEEKVRELWRAWCARRVAVKESKAVV